MKTSSLIILVFVIIVLAVDIIYKTSYSAPILSGFLYGFIMGCWWKEEDKRNK